MTTAKVDLVTATYDIKLLKETLLYAVICTKKEIEPQEAISRCAELSGHWVYVTEEEIKSRKINWYDPALPKKNRIYPTPCTDHPETHVHILANC